MKYRLIKTIHENGKATFHIEERHWLFTLNRWTISTNVDTDIVPNTEQEAKEVFQKLVNNKSVEVVIAQT